MRKLIAKLGPGLLYAGAAVGVSHLVQSTRAGASYGMAMVAVVILANLLKYPFFKAGPLYAAANGKSLLDAFQQLGKGAMFIFYGVTFTTVFAVQAVVTLITAGLFAYVFKINLPLWAISAVILAICSIILLIGKFEFLNKTMKSVIFLLTIATIVTLIAAFTKSQNAFEPLTTFSFFKQEDLFFLIALVGWMPAPIDISLWQSEWSLAQAKSKGSLSLKDALFDFRVGYWGTTFLAAAFVGLGALLIFGSGSELPASGVAFSADLIGMYTQTIGSWSFVFIAVAALATMFSTTLTVLDAFPRMLQKATKLSFPKWEITEKQNYILWLTIIVLGALFVLIFQLENMRQLVDFATTISFLTAPVLAALILIVVKRSKVQLFSKADYFVSFIGITFLILFSFYFIYLKVLN
ncbi:MAG: iron transporter [Flavobacteriales bacterium]|nr:iron transporter [Flavobacteriales bacterium]|tara:strand:+ start:33434 stop:34660 length:1227 start_codon:yes stop_codon:yes gene_type:complete